MANRLKCALLLLLGQAGVAGAQGLAADLPLFASDAPLAFRLIAPFDQLSGDGEERPDRDGTLELTGPDGQTRVIDISLRVRGNSRLERCDFPPLYLDLPRTELAGTVFDGQNELKLVALCKRSTTYRRYLAQEYLIYRFFNLLTDYSFRVRWIDVEFVHSDSRRPRSSIEPAFLIEEARDVAARHAMNEIERETLEPEDYDAEHLAMLMLFQYVIGNTDMAVIKGPTGEPCCHNGKVIGTEGGPLFLLPYDFDNAGMINAEYVAPSEVLGIRYVTNRLYRGFCIHNDELPGAIARLSAAREAMLGLLVEDDEKGNRQALRFLEESFARINEPKRVERDLIGECRP